MDWACVRGWARPSDSAGSGEGHSGTTFKPETAEARRVWHTIRACAQSTLSLYVSLLQREDSVLVVVDAQPGFFRKDWFTEDDTRSAQSALERAAWLVAVATRLEIPLVVTEEEPERNGSTEPLVAERLPSGTAVLRKGTFGLAGEPEILAAVRDTRRRTAVLVGCETDVCVAQSAIGLLDEGFACIVVDDATFSPGEMHARGLERLASAGVARNHAKGVTYEWLRTVEVAHRVLGVPGMPGAPFRL